MSWPLFTNPHSLFRQSLFTDPARILRSLFTDPTHNTDQTYGSEVLQKGLTTAARCAYSYPALTTKVNIDLHRDNKPRHREGIKDRSERTSVDTSPSAAAIEAGSLVTPRDRQLAAPGPQAIRSRDLVNEARAQPRQPMIARS